MESLSHDQYGFPLIYRREELTRLQSEIKLPDEIVDLIRTYFGAASNLYARIPLKKLHDIYNSQNNPVSQECFLQVADLISHEQHHYTILGREVFHPDEAPSQSMDRELVAEHLYAVGDAYYYETEELQDGVQYYIPPKEEFLRYTDDYYVEKTPQYLAMVCFLRRNQRKLPCPPEEIAEELHLQMTMGDDYRSMTDNARRLGVRFDNKQDFYAFLELLVNMCRHTRQFNRRGHTPAECNVPSVNIDVIAGGYEYEGDYEDGFTKTVKLLRTVLDKPQSNAFSGAPSRNAPCPCGSGRKYKNCCGKGK